MSLIEVLVAILVFSFGVLGMVGLQAQAVKLSTDSEDRTRAALLANQIVSEMWMQKTLTLPAATTDAWVARVQDAAVSGLPSANGGIATNTVDGVLVATVTVTWHSPARKPSDPDSVYRTQVAMP
jgi:type IV pilus assembly protein PilV